MTKSINAPHNPIKGIFFLIGFTILIPLVDAGAKILILDGYGPLFVTWGRFAFSAGLILPFLITRRKSAPLIFQDKWGHIVRSGLIVMATFLFFSALETTPLADAIGILFTYPLIVTLLAPVCLGEQAGKRRWLAVLAGFLGAMLIIRPTGLHIQTGYLYALGTSLCFAFFSITTRKLAQKFEPTIILGFQVCIGTIIMTAFLPFSWQTPSNFAIGIFFLIGLISLLAHIMLILAYRFTPAPVLAPYGYFEIVMASILGFLFFSEVPTSFTWAGIIIVVASGIYTSFREKWTKQSMN